jgi:glycosyltransferase involved in cell wall biosynthesis
MSEISKSLIILKTGIPSEKIIKINNPVIKRNLRILSNQDVSNDLNKIFIDNFCIVAVGRLTKQKNYLSLLKVIEKINKRFNNIFLFILGDGELRVDIDNFLKKNSIPNVKLLGFVKNPYKYMSKSKLFISTSLWEDPGHALIESAYLNIPILTSNCLSGPKEIFHHKEDAFVYDLKKKDDLYVKLIEVIKNYDVPKKFLLRSKKISKQFTLFNYYNSIKNYL